MRSILTVTTAATTSDLTTLAAVKDELNITDKASDDILKGFITGASATMAAYCKRTFGRETVTETFRQEMQWPSSDCFPNELILARFPVVSIASITEDANAALTAADWEADLAKGIVYRLSNDSQIRWQASKIVVPYVCGYVLPGDPERNLPDEIERACLMLVKLIWFAKTRDPMLKSELIPGVFEGTYYVRGEQDTGSMPLEIHSLIDPYRSGAGVI